MVRVTEKTASLELIAAPAIEKRIFVVRGRQVMLDEDLADLYGVETKRLVEQVKRNVERFPADFMFQLDEAETAALRSQIATSKPGPGRASLYPLRLYRARGGQAAGRRPVGAPPRSALIRLRSPWFKCRPVRPT
jgi:hypothetical protein